MATRSAPDNDLAWGNDYRELVQRKNDLTDDTTGKVPPTQLGTGTRDGTKYLRDDGAWAPQNSGYTAVQDEGVAVTARPTVNFTGRSVAAADNTGSARTDVTVFDTPRVHAVGNVGATVTLDAASSSGDVKTLTLTANCVATLTGSVTGREVSMHLYVKQDATGGRTLTLTGAKWQGGAPSAVSTAPNAIDRIVLVNPGDGSGWFADLVGKGYA